MSDATTRTATSRRLLRALALSVGLAILAGLAWHSRHELGEVLAHTDPLRFLVACALGVLFAVTQGAVLSQLIRKHSREHETSGLLTAFLLSQPGKYVPGKIWSSVMQALVLKRPASMAGLAVANVELAVIGMIQMTALGVACLHPSAPLLSIGVVALATGLCLALMSLPTISWLTHAFPRVARWLRFPSPDEHERPQSVLRALGLILLSFALNFAASWYVLFAAEASVSANMRLPVLASLYLGFVTSLLALPVPAGIGVREAATVGFGAILIPQAPGALLLSIAMLARCWQLVVDAACLGIGVLLQSRLARR